MKKTISIVLILVLVLSLVAEFANADYTFGEPTNLGPTVNSSADDNMPGISADGLSLYFSSNRSGGHGRYDIWMTTRPTKDDPWVEPVNLGLPVNSSGYELFGSITADGLSLYFVDKFFWQAQATPRPGGLGNGDIWVSSRSTVFDPWGTPVNLGRPVNTADYEAAPRVSSDGLSLFLVSAGLGGSGNLDTGDLDIWITTRADTFDPWTEPANLGPTVNSSSNDVSPSISSDGSALFFVSNRTGIYDLWVTMRPSVSDPFGTPVNLPRPVNSSAMEGSTCISADGSTLFFMSYRSGGFGEGDLWQVSIDPIVDFNGDGIVDAVDMCIMVDHWGEDYSLCDIGPMFWGDGIVDVEDLKVLAEYLFEEIHDPTLVAHWPLDETEGMVITDHAGDNDGYALGDPVWQPEGGMVDGALQLDGVDDYVVTGTAPNPEKGAYSVLAWIKGGAPGQVVLSQMGKANWLCADPSEGFLMTELTLSGRNGSSLGSEAVITDGNWHRIGFVWDGSYRRLYVDGVIVAEDAQDNLDISSNGLYFGTGKAMEPSTFWSGLIDDIRIYNRAVSP